MAKKQYMFYPGCSAEKLASASNYEVSVQAMCDVLDIQLNEIPDWNCCGASIGYAGGGELPRLALNARNLALAEQDHPDQDIVATCAACWLSARETKERLEDNDALMRETNEALGEAGLKYQAKQRIRHMVEVLVEDIGYEELGRHVKKPLSGLKIAGYVGCQTNRPFGIEGESFENPKYLDKMVETMGAEAVEKYDKKVSCCGGALAFSEPEKSQALIKDIIEAAYDGGAEMIVTPCPVCQMNVEVYQGQINKKYRTKFNMPVVYYSQLMGVAYGKSSKEVGLNGQVIRAKRLEELADRK
ncbi:MAG: heterodisulfide reductase [Chromatiales bacterium 21-64-14]|nr:MAG: heterodisulfide reductase [Chromatiales bacterium 21-64-14]HQU17082.1 CoB--CoM heterodisulfide reductase iron-sulfur subunit B family protein [Gammaproteobacteria bacterium]